MADLLLVACCCCPAIKFLASLQIYHRDIKLENIFMKDGSIKLADFGAALEGTRRSEVAIGSLPYAAPEVYDMLCRKPGAGPYDALAADVWSLGIVLFSLVFGHPPFSRPASNDRRYAVHMASYDASRTIVTPDAKQTAASVSSGSEAPNMLPELARCSTEMRELLFGLLHPRPHQRMTLDACMAACRQITALDAQRQAHVPVPELEGLEGARPPSIASPPLEVSMPRAITLTGSWVGRAYAADVWRSPSWHRSPLRGDASVAGMRCTPLHSRRVQSLDWNLPMLLFSQSAPPVDVIVPETANAPAPATSVATGPVSSVSSNPSLARPQVEDTVPTLSGLTGFVKQPSEVQPRPQRHLSPAVSPLRSPKPSMNAPPAATASWPAANDNAAWQMPMAVCSNRLKRPQRKRRTPKRSPQPQTHQESDACSPNTIKNPGACSGIAVTPSSLASTAATDTCARPSSCASDCSTVAMTAKLTLSPKRKAESPSPEPGPAAPLKLQRRPQSPLQLGRA